MLTTKTTCGANSLFEAVRRLPDAALEVKVYGDTQPFPDYARRLRRMVGQDPRLSLAGVYGGTEVSQVLQGLDVVVVPSVWYENSSNTVLEAFAHRTPMIASDLGGMAELVHHGENGLLFTPGDASSLALQLRRLLDEPYLLPALRAGIGPVRGVAEEMSELEEIYQAVVRNSRLRSEEASR